MSIGAVVSGGVGLEFTVVVPLVIELPPEIVMEVPYTHGAVMLEPLVTLTPAAERAVQLARLTAEPPAMVMPVPPEALFFTVIAQGWPPVPALVW